VQNNFKKFENYTKDVKGVYGIIATVACFLLSMGWNPIVIAILSAIGAGLYQVAMKSYVVAPSDYWLLVMYDGKAVQ